jgi:hypothetical protein
MGSTEWNGKFIVARPTESDPDPETSYTHDIL